MKKNYVTPEIEDFKYEVPSLYQAEESSGGQSDTHDEGGSGPGL